MAYQRHKDASVKRFVPSKETLEEIILYDELTGKIFWKSRRREFFTTKRGHSVWNAQHAGKETFLYIDQDGYKTARIFGKTLKAHRVIWKIKTGEEPNIVDHIDGNRSNNVWTNLRNGNYLTNTTNKGIMKRNTSGYNGIHFNKHVNKWETYITINKLRHRLGYFLKLEDAVEARAKADRDFGFHENHGDRCSPYVSKWERDR